MTDKEDYAIGTPIQSMDWIAELRPRKRTAAVIAETSQGTRADLPQPFTDRKEDTTTTRLRIVLPTPPPLTGIVSRVGILSPPSVSTELNPAPVASELHDLPPYPRSLSTMTNPLQKLRTPSIDSAMVLGERNCELFPTIHSEGMVLPHLSVPRPTINASLVQTVGSDGELRHSSPSALASLIWDIPEILTGPVVSLGASADIQAFLSTPDPATQAITIARITREETYDESLGEGLSIPLDVLFPERHGGGSLGLSAERPVVVLACGSADVPPDDANRANLQWLGVLKVLLREAYRLYSPVSSKPYVSLGARGPFYRALEGARADDGVFVATDESVREALDQDVRKTANEPDGTERYDHRVALKEALESLYLQRFGYMAFFLREQYHPLKKLLGAGSYHPVLIEIGSPTIDPKRHASFCEAFWGVSLGHRSFAALDGAFIAGERAFYQKLWDLTADVKYAMVAKRARHQPGSQGDESPLHYQLKILTIAALTEQLHVPLKDIRTEAPFGAGEDTYYPDVDFPDGLVEIETFYGEGTAPIAKVMRDVEKAEKIGKQLRLLVPPVAATLLGTELMSVRKELRKKRKGFFEIWVPIVGEKKVVPITKYFERLAQAATLDDSKASSPVKG